MHTIVKQIRSRVCNNNLLVMVDSEDRGLFNTRWSVVRKYIGKCDSKGMWYLHQAILGPEARSVSFEDGDIFNYCRANLRASVPRIEAVGYSPVNRRWWAFANTVGGCRFCGLFESEETAYGAQEEFLEYYKSRRDDSKT